MAHPVGIDAMAIAIVILLLVIISLAFHFFSPWWFTPIASNWSDIDQTINLTFWVTGIVFVAVNLFLAYTIYRFRFDKNRRADFDPENTKLEIGLTVLTTIGVVAMLAPGLWVWDKFVTVPDNAEVFEAVGQQWHWSYRLPGKDGQLGQTSVMLMDENNPFGIDPLDANGLDDVLIASNEMHLKIDQPMKVLLRSKDVLHNFAVPQFRVKMDLVPGIVTYLWFTPTRLGRFELLCEELCGVAHYTMRGHIVVDTVEDYQQWLDNQPTFAETMNKPAADIVNGKRLYGRCAGCHGANAEGNEVFQAPQLAGQSVWYLRRQLHYYQQQVRGGETGDTVGQQMAAMAATLSSDHEVSDIAAYLNSLPAQHIAADIPDSIDSVNRGRRLYQNCSHCHGNRAQGLFALNAPKLTDQHGWYLQRQLENYKKMVRGMHQGDLYGSQMVLMARLLQTEQSVEDVIVYIQTLSKHRQPPLPVSHRQAAMMLPPLKSMPGSGQ
jgi:cytochrome c oxidase subunit 2